jgi:hypothetical protein
LAPELSRRALDHIAKVRAAAVQQSPTLRAFIAKIRS